ncbi:endonuclease/exonuclease/phosphatase family protein [Haloarchaeobius sp. DFWS5]|uniref:endonuclease/exonuclease/phosphatase family protein n=1 Tax=Haloarchaeobius sp. DFWS5 TaxID=3446114 RepID=UPI003EB75474
MTAQHTELDSLTAALFTAALVVTFVVTFERTVSRIYLLNFSTAGPNATALLMFLLATGWTISVVDALGSRRSLALSAAGIAVPLLLGVTMVTGPLPAVVAAIGVQLALVPLFVAVVRRSPGSVAPGAATGLLAAIALRGAFDVAPAYATTPGRVFALVVGLVVAAGAVWVGRRDAPTTGESAAAGGVDLTPLLLFCAVEATFLGAPAVLATWQFRSYELTLAASALGLVAAAVFVALRGEPAHRVAPLLAAGFTLSLADLLWLDLLGPVAAAPAQAFAVLLLAQGVSGAGESRWRWKTTVGAQLLAVVLVFLHVSALNAEYMPGPVFSLTHERAAAFLFALGALFPLSVLAQGRSLAQPGVDSDRRTALTSVGAAALGVGTIALPSRIGSADEPDGSELTVMTYNVHQFLAGDHGEYNLHDVAAVIEDSGAQVVGLQESEGNRITSGNVDGVRWLAEELGYHSHYGVPTSDATYGVAVLSAWPIVDSEVVSLSTYQSPPRLAMRVTLDTPDGEQPFVVTHLQTQQQGTPEAIEMQGVEAEEVVDLAGDGDDAIVVGDFNVEPGDDTAYTVMADSFTDAWAAVHESEQGGGTWPGDDPEMRIDYVWTADGWAVKASAVHGDGEDSDHRAVSATLTRS